MAFLQLAHKLLIDMHVRHASACSGYYIGKIKVQYWDSTVRLLQFRNFPYVSLVATDVSLTALNDYG